LKIWKMESFKFMSSNVGMSGRLGGLIMRLQKGSVDVVFLQEINLNTENLNLMVKRYGYQAEASYNENFDKKPGIAVVWKEGVPLNNIEQVVEGRLMRATMGQYLLLNVYAPSGSDKRMERKKFYEQEVYRELRGNLGKPCIMGGDFNAILGLRDVEDGVGFAQKKCNELQELVNVSGLGDVFRRKFPMKREYTFFRKGRAPSRLDKWYVTEKMLENVVKIEHVATLADHCGVIMEIKLELEREKILRIKRETYWKLNTAILEEDYFTRTFAKFWNHLSLSKENFNDLDIWWDKKAKPEIKSFCIGMSKQRKLQREDTRSFFV
jgi:exonuclease III